MAKKYTGISSPEIRNPGISTPALSALRQSEAMAMIEGLNIDPLPPEEWTGAHYDAMDAEDEQEPERKRSSKSGAGAKARAVTRNVLGAWLLRSNPDVWDIAGWIADGDLYITNWTVANNYRSSMMQPGDRVLLWVSGNSKKMARGIWGLGEVTGYVQDAIPDDDDADAVDYWLDEDRRAAEEYCIDVYIPILDQPLTDSQLRSAGIRNLEVQIQPQISNPSWISKEQLAALEHLTPEWPEPQMHDAEELTVSEQRGAGFGDPFENRVVEAAAMAAVQAFYEDAEWNVTDVSADKVGWDLTCTSRDGDEARVEVKGTRSTTPRVLLTNNEVRAAREFDNWYLAVVTTALNAPQVVEYDAEVVLRAIKPYVYQAHLE